MRIDDYRVSEDRGFLAEFNPDQVTLPADLMPIKQTALALPNLLPTGRIRGLLADLPQPGLAQFCATASDPELRMAMVHYAFLVQAYVWGEAEATNVLPENLAQPIWQLARRIGQLPLLPYSSYVLDNWGRIDADGAMETANLHTVQSFLGGQDEAWFILIHVAIEASAGAMLARIPRLITAANQSDVSGLEEGLSIASRVWDDMIAIFDRMPERCDPYIYFHRVRPWIHGWKDNPALGEGLIYSGVAETKGLPQSFRGQTGSQSSIVPTMDALLGIDHAQDPLRIYLNELHAYRPPCHRKFIDDVRAQSRVREVVSQIGSRSLKTLYNDCVMKLTKFRTRHLQYAASYINKQSACDKGNAADVGTGGTPFMKYLKKHRNETEKHLLVCEGG